MRIARRHLPALGLAALLPRAAEAALSGPFGGVYATPPPLFDARRLLPDAVFRDRAASGVYVRLVWSQLEPRPGEHDFSLLDREVARAVAAGRRISLSLIPGGYAPPWLAAQGIATLRFEVGRGGANRACLATEMGVPWDPGFIAAFTRAHAAIAARLRATPGAWEALRIVKLTGLNRLTEEARLPALDGTRQDACGAPDEVARWLAAGYRPSRAVEAWGRIARALAATYPGRLLALDVLERNDFPAVDEAGRPLRDSDVKPRLIAEGLRLAPGRFAVQWNGLTAEGPLSEAVLAAGRQGAVIGWQSNAFRGLQGAGCNAARRAAPEPCDDGGFAAILARGVATGAAYIEAWAADVLRFPEAVRAADARLAAQAAARQGG